MIDTEHIHTEVRKWWNYQWAVLWDFVWQTRAMFDFFLRNGNACFDKVLYFQKKKEQYAICLFLPRWMKFLQLMTNNDNNMDGCLTSNTLIGRFRIHPPTKHDSLMFIVGVIVVLNFNIFCCFCFIYLLC